ncbi:MAG: phage major capsid protein, P2 family [Thiomicrospira sp.]|nr:MAG: phage major capsid protein, P2 family [Thiomicrospira sp.]
MQNFTRKKVNELELAMAQQYAVDNVAQKFAVTPAVAQVMVAAIKTDNSFLNKINVMMVLPQSGEAIAVNAVGMIANKTDTSANDRAPVDPSSLGGTPYACLQVNFDTFLKYSTLDAWAHLKNFQTLVASQTRKQIASNMIMIGFYGESVAATSDPVANPKGQDIAKGWYQKLRENAPEKIILEGVPASGAIKIGTGGDYLNLDVAVNDIKQLIDEPFDEDGDLVVIVGSELLANDKAKFYSDNGNTPSEKAMIEDKQVIGTYGGLPAFKIPNFPARGLMITSFNNLSIYIQEASIRRSMLDNPKRDRYETYQSQEMDYVIEELGKIAALEFKNVQITEDGGTSWI